MIAWSGRPLAARLALLGAMIAAAGAAAPARAASLADAVRLAYATNPQLLAQRAALRNLDESYVQARGALGPQVSVTAQVEGQDAYVDQPGSPFTPATTANSKARTDAESLSISQVLYNGGQSASAINAATADILTGRQQLRSAEIQLMQQVVTAYADVRRDMQVYAITRESVAQLVKALDQTESKFKVHEVTATDRAQALARLAAARATLSNAQGRLQVSRTQYLQVVGENPADLDPEPALAHVPAVLQEAFDLGEANSPTLLASKFTEQASRARIDQEKTANNATVSLHMDATSGPVEPYDPRFYDRNFSVRVQLNKPLFTSGINASRVRAARDRNDRDRLTVDATHRQMIQQVAQAWNQLAASSGALGAQEDQVAAQTVAYDSVQQELKAGLRTTIEVLNAEQELQNSKIEVVQARHDQYLAEAALLAAAGLLQARELVPDVAVYSPEKAFRAVADKGAPPWIGLVQSIDGLRAPKPGPIAIHDPAGETRPDVAAARPDLGPAEAGKTP